MPTRLISIESQPKKVDVVVAYAEFLRLVLQENPTLGLI